MPLMSYPLANASGLTGTKDQMRSQNERRIRAYLERVIPYPQNVRQHGACGHRQTQPILVTGRTTNGWMAGAYMQKVSSISFRVDA